MLIRWNQTFVELKVPEGYSKLRKICPVEWDTLPNLKVQRMKLLFSSSPLPATTSSRTSNAIRCLNVGESSSMHSIRYMLAREWTVRVQHVYREANF